MNNRWRSEIEAKRPAGARKRSQSDILQRKTFGGREDDGKNENIDVGIVRNLCRGFLASPPSALNPSYNSFTRFALSQPRSTERDHKRSVLTRLRGLAGFEDTPLL
jgi:hypothetical protein